MSFTPRHLDYAVPVRSGEVRVETSKDGAMIRVGPPRPLELWKGLHSHWKLFVPLSTLVVLIATFFARHMQDVRRLGAGWILLLLVLWLWIVCGREFLRAFRCRRQESRILLSGDTLVVPWITRRMETGTVPAKLVTDVSVGARRTLLSGIIWFVQIDLADGRSIGMFSGFNPATLAEILVRLRELLKEQLSESRSPQ
jgi:hypothetical protein